MIRTLKSKGKSHALLESPTGSGKSMAILCGALAWLEVEKKKHAAALKERARLEKQQQGGEPDAKKAKTDCATCDGCALPEEKAVNTIASVPPVPKIYFASRTHKQLGQLVKELRRSGYSPRFTVLASRNQYCINNHVRTQADVNEACRNEFKDCPYSNKIAKMAEKFASMKLSTNMDIEDLVNWGKAEKVCPYFMAREAASHADIIFAPYNYITDPGIRSAMAMKLENAVVIIDEAHNIEDTCRSSGSFEILSDNLSAIQFELNGLLSGVGEKACKCPDSHRKMLHVASIFHTWLNQNLADAKSIKLYEEKVDIWRGEDIKNALAQLGINPDSLDDWRKHLESIVQKSIQMMSENNGNRGEDDDDIIMSTGSCRIFQGLFNTLDVLLNKEHAIDSYRMVRVTKAKPDRANNRRLEIMLGFWCLSPDVVFRPLANEVKSIILTSGTLSPMNTFASELRTSFEERLEAMHIINPEQVWIGCLPNSPSGLSFLGNFKNMETFQFQDSLGECILDICKAVPFGVLCFLPSYAFMDKLIQRLKTVGLYDKISATKRIFLEPRQGSTKEFEALMRRYYDCISACKEGVSFSARNAGITGALFFAVYRGKVSEGLDLADENCRAVIPVGIPYPAFKDQKVILKREYNDQYSASKHILTGHQWYETQAFRALNQALGRCIRHRLDWGAIILLEQRFLYANNVNQLSKWVRSKVQVFKDFRSGMGSLQTFVDYNRLNDKKLSAEISEIKANMSTEQVSLEDEETVVY